MHPVRVASFEWDHVNIAHIARHQVQPHEIEEVFYSEPRVFRGRRRRFLAYGQSFSGRYLFVVFEARSQGRIRVITAREMSAKEKQRVRQWQRKRR